MSEPPIVVVGSGAAGLPAALAAARDGARVLVLESAPYLGGALAMSGGGAWLPNTSLHSVDDWGPDSPGDVLTYLRRLTLGSVPDELLAAFVEKAPEAFEFLRERAPIEFLLVGTPDYQADLPGATRGGRQLSVGLYDLNRLGEHRELLRPLPPGGHLPLTHDEMLVEGWGLGTSEDAEAMRRLAAQRLRDGIAGRGNALAAALIEACLGQGVAFETSTRVTALDESADGRIEGVRAVRDGTEVRIAARAVIVATGGFEWDQELWDAHVATPADGALSPPFGRGDGLRMAIQAKARLALLHTVAWCPGIRVPGETLDGEPAFRFFSVSRSMPGAIVVNRSGRRFVNESINYNDFGQAMAGFDSQTYEFPNLPAWVVMDEEHVERYGLLRKDHGPGWLHAADSLEELAGDIGVDPVGLRDQVREFNAAASDGRDPQFYRESPTSSTYRADVAHTGPPVRPLEGDRFFAFRQLLTSIGTKGGAVTDGDARVLDLHGRAVPGLFVAGNAAASVFGRSYPGGGGTLGPAFVFGYAAGKAAAA